MANWRPLSKRGQPDPRLDEPTEGLPPYLAGPVTDWLRDRLIEPGYAGQVRGQAIKVLQLEFKLEPPLAWRNEGTAAFDLLERVLDNEEFGLDVVDYVLHHLNHFTSQYDNPADHASELHAILRLGGSVWEVTPSGEDGSHQLSRRAAGPVREAIESVPEATRAHQHLVAAWNRLSGRNPDESSAYREAIRAVEAAAKPVVSPSDPKATLGTMIAALRDKPAKWETTLGTVEGVRQQMEAVWKGQRDRHGTDDESVPPSVSPEEADAAFSICLDLVRLFTGGHVRSAGGS